MALNGNLGIPCHFSRVTVRGQSGLLSEVALLRYTDEPGKRAVRQDGEFLQMEILPT
jgi:hypothetical protein